MLPFRNGLDGLTWDRKFDAILSNPANQYWFQLTPGKLLSTPAFVSFVLTWRKLTFAVFDNWRVLHGRAAFTGKRRMCGGYINRDDWVSKFRQTNMTSQEIEESTVTG